MMNMPGKILSKYPEIDTWSIITAYRGSIAHGLYVASAAENSIDDKDIISICIPPISYYFGLKEYGSRGTKEIKYAEWDIVVYEFKKCINLLKQGNPNILSLLWLDEKSYIKISQAGERLINARNLFVGKHVYQSFIGYAQSQFHKMTHLGFQGYLGVKRKTLVQKYGYDTKNACHLIRLLTMGIEFLKEGRLYVKRSDVKYLWSIKRGEWTLEEVKKESEKLFKEAEKAYKKSKLPEHPDYNKIETLGVDILKDHFRLKGRSGAES
ncbi:MAG: nucleotidyltransferase domain-containing protein [Elusimicrobia bacterium]|nr:nucleotidyltransferase domain-containing protein [Elusimicrobiota bacterium]